MVVHSSTLSYLFSEHCFFASAHIRGLMLVCFAFIAGSFLLVSSCLCQFDEVCIDSLSLLRGISLFFLRRMFELTNPINRSEDSPRCRHSVSFHLGVKLSAVWSNSFDGQSPFNSDGLTDHSAFIFRVQEVKRNCPCSLSLLERIVVVYSSHIGCCSLLLWLFLYRSFHSFSSYLYAETNSLFLACCYCFSVRLDWFFFILYFQFYIFEDQKSHSVCLSIYRFSVSFACLFNERKKNTQPNEWYELSLDVLKRSDLSRIPKWDNGIPFSRHALSRSLSSLATASEDASIHSKSRGTKCLSGEQRISSCWPRRSLHCFCRINRSSWHFYHASFNIVYYCKALLIDRNCWNEKLFSPMI